ncbi:unnamed protein product [Amoebophrya sp. A120]|nr:unnamed protein product [Amoebophrya sp. A120]|eukprot:GSA120T00022971001.1
MSATPVGNGPAAPARAELSAPLVGNTTTRRRGRWRPVQDYFREPMRFVYMCYATLDRLAPFPGSLVAIVGTLVFFLLIGCFTMPSKELTWLLIQVLRQWALMLLVNSAESVLHAGPVWIVVLIAAALWVLQLMGYLLFVEGWLLLATEPFRVLPSALVFVCLLTYSALLCVKLVIYLCPHSLAAELFLADLGVAAAQNRRNAAAEPERPPPLPVDVLKLLVQGRVVDLWTPRTQVAELEGKPCAVCCDEFTGTDVVINLPCQHVFHQECVLEWFTRGNRECPLCRRDVEETLHHSPTSSYGHGVNASATSPDTFYCPEALPGVEDAPGEREQLAQRPGGGSADNTRNRSSPWSGNTSRGGPPVANANAGRSPVVQRNGSAVFPPVVAVPHARTGPRFFPDAQGAYNEEDPPPLLPDVIL